MKKWIKKKLCTLKQNHYRSCKNECSFFKSIFRSGFRLFDWLHLIVHWYLFFYLVQLEVCLLRLFHVLREVREVRQRGQ